MFKMSEQKICFTQYKGRYELLFVCLFLFAKYKYIYIFFSDESTFLFLGENFRENRGLVLLLKRKLLCRGSECKTTPKSETFP